jgi:hypothetical protein
MARAWRRSIGRWISTDFGIAADLPSGRDFADDGQPHADFAAPKGQQGRRLLFCEWVRQRGGHRTRRD